MNASDKTDPISDHDRMKAALEKIAAFDLRDQPGPYTAGFNKSAKILKSWAARALERCGQ